MTATLLFRFIPLVYEFHFSFSTASITVLFTHSLLVTKPEELLSVISHCI